MTVVNDVTMSPNQAVATLMHMDDTIAGSLVAVASAQQVLVERQTIAYMQLAQLAATPAMDGVVDLDRFRTLGSLTGLPDPYRLVVDVVVGTGMPEDKVMDHVLRDDAVWVQPQVWSSDVSGAAGMTACGWCLAETKACREHRMPLSAWARELEEFYGGGEWMVWSGQANAWVDAMGNTGVPDSGFRMGARQARNLVGEVSARVMVPVSALVSTVPRRFDEVVAAAARWQEWRTVVGKLMELREAAESEVV